MGEHSKTPWELRGAATLRAADGDYVATLENNGRRSANAAFIVLAVNCHDELVNALSEISELRMYDLPASSPMTEYDLATSIIRKARGIAKIALAKARGETP